MTSAVKLVMAAMWSPAVVTTNSAVALSAASGRISLAKESVALAPAAI